MTLTWNICLNSTEKCLLSRAYIAFYQKYTEHEKIPQLQASQIPIKRKLSQIVGRTIEI